MEKYSLLFKILFLCLLLRWSIVKTYRKIIPILDNYIFLKSEKFPYHPKGKKIFHALQTYLYFDKEHIDNWNDCHSKWSLIEQSELLKYINPLESVSLQYFSKEKVSLIEEMLERFDYCHECGKLSLQPQKTCGMCIGSNRMTQSKNSNVGSYSARKRKRFIIRWRWRFRQLSLILKEFAQKGKTV